MASVGVLIMLGIQFASMSGNKMLGKNVSDAKRNTPFLKLFNLLYEYVPFWGKDIIVVEK